MNATEVGTQLVAFCKEGKYEEVYGALYSPEIVSIEASGPNREYRGFEGIKAKNDWWEATFEVLGMEVVGPYPHGEDEFAIRFIMETKHRESGEVNKMDEVAVYEVKDGKIVKEKFYYSE